MTALLQPGFDRVVRSALLGLQFRDAVDGRVVGEGLEVQIQDLWQPRRHQMLTANRSGIFALHAFAGLRGDDDDAIDSPTGPGRFRVDVRDTRGRYLPLALQPELPAGGLWSPDGGGASPPTATPHVRLFSAATRPIPVAMASLRAELRRASRPDLPAPWARLELWLSASRIAEGQADAAGRALLVFPLPRPREALLGASPPVGPPPAFEWTVTLRAFWSPALAADAVPDLDAVLDQPAATLLPSSASRVPLPALLLRAGETLQAARRPSSFVYVAE